MTISFLRFFYSQFSLLSPFAPPPPPLPDLSTVYQHFVMKGIFFINSDFSHNLEP